MSENQLDNREEPKDDVEGHVFEQAEQAEQPDVEGHVLEQAEEPDVEGHRMIEQVEQVEQVE